MSNKKLKQKVAVALITAMSATNIFSAVAAESKATIGKPSSSSSTVKVNFDARGGIGGLI